MPTTSFSPAVSVVMAVHNGLPYLDSALRSIMGQTLRKIEIIVVDDASTDGTAGVLQQLAAEDPRIRVITAPTNLKLPRALNRGLEEARAPYVARMDADDIAYPERLARQKAYLDAHPSVVLLGTSVRRIDQNGTLIRLGRRHLGTTATRWFARFNMPLVHPTFMSRRFAEGNTFQTYSPEAGYAEDYDFVARALAYGDVSVLPEILLDYRVHGTSISGKNWKAQQGHAREIAMRVQRAELPASVVEALAPFRAAYYDLTAAAPEKIFAGLRAMLDHDANRLPAHRTWMRRHAAQLAVTAMRRSGSSNLAVLRAFLTSGRDFLPALGLRFLETQRLLPAALQAHPIVD
jgi:glycosyltransferase involved in cell wall biosynthesis